MRCSAVELEWQSYFFSFSLSNSWAFFLMPCRRISIFFSIFRIKILHFERALCKKICFLKKSKWKSLSFFSTFRISSLFLKPWWPFWGSCTKTGIFLYSIKQNPRNERIKTMRAIICTTLAF